MGIDLNLNRGYLIVFEGIDGSGKSGHSKLLGEYLAHKGFGVLQLSEPTKGRWGIKIREVLANGRRGLAPDEELQLFINDRKEDVANNINPALAQNKVILLDRYYFSTAAYQGALGLDPDAICRENETFAPAPDLVLLFHCSPEECLRRIKKSRGSFSSFEKLEYLKEVQDIFATFTHPEIKRIDSDRPKDTVHGHVVSEVNALLQIE